MGQTRRSEAADIIHVGVKGWAAATVTHGCHFLVSEIYWRVKRRALYDKVLRRRFKTRQNVRFGGVGARRPARPPSKWVSIAYKRYILHTTFALYGPARHNEHLRGSDSVSHLSKYLTVTVRDTRTQARLRTTPALSVRSREFVRALPCHQLVHSLSVRASGHD